MKTLTVLLLSSSLTFCCYSQVTFQCVYQANVGSWSGFLQQTTDHGYIMTGSNGYWTAGGLDIYLVKTDSMGTAQWGKSYGGSADDYANAVVQTYDGGYLAGGHTNSFGNVMYAVKTDAAGNLVWSKTYDSGEIFSIARTADSNYVLCAYGSSSVILIKIDTAGAIIWEKRYGGAGIDVGISVEQTRDTGFVIGGYTSSFGAGGSDYYLIKTDSTGTLQWSKTFGGADEEQCYCVHQTRDGGYILSGLSYGYGMGGNDFYVVRTDADGNMLWNKSYGEAGADYGSYIVQSDDGGYVLTGANTHTQNPYSLSLLGLDQQGNILWKKGYAGSFLETWGLTIITTTDGGYAVGGYTELPPSSQPFIYLLKTDANGNGGCDFPTDATVTIPVPLVTTPATVTSPGGNIAGPATAVHPGWYDGRLCLDASADNLSRQRAALTVYPNPFHTAAKINSTEISSYPAILKIYNTIGALVKEQTISGPGAVINREGLENGIYFIRVSSDEGEWVGKIIIE
jgi:hypothetical protein